MAIVSTTTSILSPLPTWPCGNPPSNPPSRITTHFCPRNPSRHVNGSDFVPTLTPILPLRLSVACSATQEKEKQTVDEVTRKFGLEVGLWKIFTTKDDSGQEGKGNKSMQAKDLLARYGGAYLATSISLSLVSFGLCYFLISSGVDVASLLEKVGIHTNETGEQVGTFALAYAAHKAASPIRFPPTVALTPIVAGWFGKKIDSRREKIE